jgi:putative endonuclease
MDKDYYVYVLADQRNGTPYVRVSSNLLRRIREHKNKAIDGRICILS